MHEDSRTAVDRPTGMHIQAHKSRDGHDWYIGYVRTPHGIASVYSEPKLTTVGFIHRGYEYSRQYQRGYQPRHLVTLAARLAQEVCHGQKH